MKLSAKLFVLFGLVIFSFSAVAASNLHNVFVHDRNADKLYFNVAGVNALCKDADQLGIDCGTGHGWGETTATVLLISGDHYDKDVFLIQDRRGEDVIFPDLDTAKNFEAKFLNAVHHPLKETIQFYTSNTNRLSKVVVAVLYKENGVTKFLIFPNKWGDVGENHIYQYQDSSFLVPADQKLHLTSPF